MDNPDQQISLDILELLGLCQMVLQKTIEQGTQEVRIGQDFYWSFVPEQRYDVYEEPRDFTIGQISFDLDNLRSLAEDLDFIPPNALVWLARLLEALGDELMP